MKKIYLLLVAWLLGFYCYGQNWLPVNTSDRYNYRLDGANLITNVIKVDSAKVINGDSVFYLNRILKTFDGQPFDAIRDFPQFLQRKIVKRPNGELNLREFGNLVILTTANVNDSWVFDSINNVSAQLINVNNKVIFGNLDSVKVLLLSTGDTILHSKNHGVLLYPDGYGHNRYYRLVGIEGRNVGELMPKSTDFFDFEVGDIFQTYSWEWDGGQGTGWRTKFRITSKNVSGNVMVYNAEGFQLIYSLPNSYGYITEPIYSMPYQEQDTTDRFLLNTTFPNQESLSVGCMSGLYSFMRFHRDSTGLLTAQWGDSSWTSTFYTPVDSLSDTLMTVHQPAQNFKAYKVGLGLIGMGFGCLDSGHFFELEAYKTSTDSAGTLLPDSLFVGMEEKNFLIHLYPNPFADFLSVHVDGVNKGRIKIIDLQGQTLLEQDLSGPTTQLNLSKLTTGAYIVELETRDSVQRRKIIKLN